ncbi:Hypothetical protein, putative [Bodo saltans]|uniref:Uncharacterized protein n=1 Tax=Bodo saltans TaxID=75058 RepID=A0A0S4IMY5_BODSA|nr:Hypothetical protein, putative [Bodo saltans]|eukprot:CUE73150.1 Hypothetical protein, putative [Bodo saltans]
MVTIVDVVSLRRRRCAGRGGQGGQLGCQQRSRCTGLWRGAVLHVSQEPNRQKEDRRSPPSMLRVVRMHGHFATFFTLLATEQQIDAVCNHKQLPPRFQKMILISDTPDPACIVGKRAGASRDTREYLGFDLLKKSQRRQAQLRKTLW